MSQHWPPFTPMLVRATLVRRWTRWLPGSAPGRVAVLRRGDCPTYQDLYARGSLEAPSGSYSPSSSAGCDHGLAA
eukprot:13234310-Heterocapsa_arctica.AAC.1